MSEPELWVTCPEHRTGPVGWHGGRECVGLRRVPDGAVERLARGLCAHNNPPCQFCQTRAATLWRLTIGEGQ